MAASPSLSEGEFHRMQLQLIELRTTNYETEAKNKRLERELSEANDKIEQLNKELGKAKQAISKSKKAKDVEVLIQESDSLQRKLLSQEEEFRLQNQTLMAELSLLVSSNEELKKELECLKSSSAATASETESSNNDEMCRLQAENLALQKNLNALQERFDKEVLIKAETQGEAPSENVPSPDRDYTGDEGCTEEVDGVKRPASSSPPPDYGELINKLRLELDTELEEKKLIKSQLEQKKKESQEQLSALQEEIEKANEKLKRKQESYLQLHAEKEQLFKEISAKLEETQAARDRDQKYYKDLMAKQAAEIEKARKEIEQHQAHKDKQAEELRQQIAQLQKQVDTSGMVATHQLQEQSGKYLAEITVLRDLLARTTKERDDVYAQLQESRRVAEDSVSQMQAALAERDTQITSMQEISKVAEKRKSLLDELSIKYQEEYDAHRDNLAKMEAKHLEVVDGLKAEMADKSRKMNELSRQVAVVEELNKKVHALEDTKGWLERRLTETEEQLASAVTSFEEERESMKKEKLSEIEALNLRHQEEMGRLQEESGRCLAEWALKEASLNQELEQINATISQLKQQIKDKEDDKKLHEKKGMIVLKDLKRQLHAERKRAEKLQLKLQEVLSEDSNKHMEDFFRTPDSDLQETSSLSSWGAGASGLCRDSVASGPQSPISGHNSHSSDTSVGDEYNDLLKRVAALQQEKWALEEKVNHLETSNSCMAEDILKKTSIIEHYVMESRTGPKPSHPHEEKLTLKKVMDLVNKNSDHAQHAQDMNKKLQSMLEETLTKNMHLQQDLEVMSQEVVRLSKLTAPAVPDNSKQSKPKEVAAPPTTLSLASTTAVPAPPTEHIPQTSSVTSEDNFEMVSSTVGSDAEYDVKVSENPESS
ncbi:GRIP1-associated protein 1-like [Physella acuta]|uniref:GRIP1-associated protein 1-like n=1 Tax=Physella acuta TaxID=109671 RepID=UPI0027DDABAE|nr:GRIP1-associated protein 1-like [Physella acuta]